MTSNRPPMLAADHIRELILGFSTTEPIRQPVLDPDGRWRTRTSTHTVWHDALLDQIEETVTGTTMGGEFFRAAYGSKPAGRMDCLAFLRRLERQSTLIATDHGIEPLPLRQRLSRIAGAVGARSNHTIESWWATARILTQHDSPPYAPNVPCPNEACEQRGSLRIRFDPGIGTCVECHDVWGEDRVALLGRWCAWASEHLKGRRHLVPGEAHGYDAPGYLVVCPECEPTRAEMDARAAVRLAVAKAAKLRRAA